MSSLTSTVRAVTTASANVAAVGLRTGLAVTTQLSLGVRRFLRPDAPTR